jgi:hypothetical protein
MEPKTSGGVAASSINLDNHSNRLVHIRYKDHIEFKNTSHKLYFDVNLREAVGWIVLETDEYLFILYDRSVKSLPHEASQSGLILIKSDILEMKEVK